MDTAEGWKNWRGAAFYRSARRKHGTYEWWSVQVTCIATHLWATAKHCQKSRNLVKEKQFVQVTVCLIYFLFVRINKSSPIKARSMFCLKHGSNEESKDHCVVNMISITSRGFLSEETFLQWKVTGQKIFYDSDFLVENFFCWKKCFNGTLFNLL